MVPYLVPYLIGCYDEGSPSASNRYIFGNANATVDYDDAETCQIETELPCYPVAVTLDLSLKENQEISSLISLLDNLIESDGTGASLTDRLNLSDDFNEVVLGDVDTEFAAFVKCNSIRKHMGWEKRKVALNMRYRKKSKYKVGS